MASERKESWSPIKAALLARQHKFMKDGQELSVAEFTEHVTPKGQYWYVKYDDVPLRLIGTPEQMSSALESFFTALSPTHYKVVQELLKTQLAPNELANFITNNAIKYDYSMFDQQLRDLYPEIAASYQLYQKELNDFERKQPMILKLPSSQVALRTPPALSMPESPPGSQPGSETVTTSPVQWSQPGMELPPHWTPPTITGMTWRPQALEVEPRGSPPPVIYALDSADTSFLPFRFVY